MEPRAPNVLIVYDGSESSRRALERVGTLMPNASVAVVTVALPVYRDPMSSKFAAEADEKLQRAAAAEAEARLVESGISARSAMPVGDAAAEIVRIGEASGADLN